LVGKPEGERPLRKPRFRWEDNIRMDIMGIGWKGVDWMYVAQVMDHCWDLVNTIMNLHFS
jgi:hypothetical protein